WPRVLQVAGRRKSASVFFRRGAGPAQEGVMKGAGIRKASQQRHFGERQRGIAQVRKRQIAPRVVEQRLKSGTLLLQPSLQGATAHAQRSRQVLQSRRTSGQLFHQRAPRRL